MQQYAAARKDFFMLNKIDKDFFL